MHDKSRSQLGQAHQHAAVGDADDVGVDDVHVISSLPRELAGVFEDLPLQHLGCLPDGEARRKGVAGQRHPLSRIAAPAVRHRAQTGRFRRHRRRSFDASFGRNGRSEPDRQILIGKAICKKHFQRAGIA